MELEVRLSTADVEAACQNYIEEKLLLNGPGWHIECDNNYAIRVLEFKVSRNVPIDLPPATPEAA